MPREPGPSAQDAPPRTSNEIPPPRWLSAGSLPLEYDEDVGEAIDLDKANLPPGFEEAPTPFLDAIFGLSFTLFARGRISPFSPSNIIQLLYMIIYIQ